MFKNLGASNLLKPNKKKIPYTRNLTSFSRRVRGLKMPFKRFVETGRVAYISDGPNKGKLCCIVDVINQTQALVDGPETGVPRQGIRLNQLHLTKFRLKFPYTGKTRVVRKAWNEAKLNEKWASTMWARKVDAKKKRAELTDFDRFKLNNARSIRNKLRTTAFLHLKRLSKKSRAAKGAKKDAKPAKKAAPPKKAK